MAYLNLDKLNIYQKSLVLSEKSWKIYERMDWQTKKIVGDQFLMSIDSIGANIAEGYGRYHYLDRIKFCYNARGSLLESIHWLTLFKNRRIINQLEFDEILSLLEELKRSLNSYINSIYKSKDKVEKK